MCFLNSKTNVHQKLILKSAKVSSSLCINLFSLQRIFKEGLHFRKLLFDQEKWEKARKIEDRKFDQNLPFVRLLRRRRVPERSFFRNAQWLKIRHWSHYKTSEGGKS